MNGHNALLNTLEKLGWPAKAAAELTRGVHIVSYEKSGTIFHAGEVADLVYFLLSGEVALEYTAASGSLIVSIARCGQMLGVFAPDLGATAKTRAEQLFTAQALSRCVVAILPTARIAHGMQQLPAVDLVLVLESSREEWIRLCRRMLGYLTMSVRQRLAHVLNELAEQFGITDPRGELIPIRLSHENLAALVGASRPMVSKELKALESAGSLRREAGRYRVLPPLRLVNAADNGQGAATDGHGVAKAGDRRAGRLTIRRSSSREGEEPASDDKSGNIVEV